MTDPTETKENLRQRLAALQHKDRWDDRDRKEIRAIQAALSCLPQHIPAPSRERSSGCCGPLADGDGGCSTRREEKTGDNGGPEAEAGFRGTHAGVKTP